MDVLIDYINELNVIAVLAASVAAFASGAVWYAEPVFGKAWMKAVGLSKKDAEKADMPKIMGVSFLGIIVSAAAIGVLVQVLDLNTAIQGALFGVMAAVGLLASNKLMMVLFEQRPVSYWWITLGGDVVSFAIMGAILAVWQ